MSQQITIILECSVCKNRNYKVRRGKDKKNLKLEIKKYCKFCQEHTLHKSLR